MAFVAHNFLEDLALVMCVAAVATIIFQLLRQPLVVGYLVAGMALGAHVAIPLYASQTRIRTISELGVVMLIFSIGLEFDLRKLLRLAPTAGLITIIQVAIMIGLGYLASHLMGWNAMESLFTGSIVCISSTTIVAKAFEEHRVEARLREVCFGILLAEDLMAILLLAVLTVAAKERVFSLAILPWVAGRLAAFLAVLLAGGLLTVPYLIRGVVRLRRSETLMVASIGVCFGFSLLAEEFGYSVALGAFLAGSLVSHSGHGELVESSIAPIRDLFGAIFFVSVGMLIEPAQLIHYWPALLILTAVVVGGKILGISIGAMISGERPWIATRAGFALAQIGEFAFIMADVGVRNGATGDFLYTLAVAVSAITAFLTPYMIRASVPATHAVRRVVPAQFHYLARRYGNWIGRFH